MLVSTSASAWHHAYRHHCCGCYYGYGKGLVYTIVKRLRAEPATSDQPIYVSARGREVMLSGYVGTAPQKQEAIDIARYTCGVRLVVDNLHIQTP
jgi:hypothetical protein